MRLQNRHPAPTGLVYIEGQFLGETDYAGMCSQDLADLVFAQPDGFLGGKG
jgi:hypothetical protein